MPEAQEVGDCNVCSAQFTTLPFHGTVGHSFVAECSYISKLIPPDQFTKAKEDLIEKILSKNISSEDIGYREPPPKLNWQLQRSSWVGTQRYAIEHWVYSHPSVRPCQVFPFSFAYNSYGNVPENYTDLIPNRTMSPKGKLSRRQSRNYHPWFLFHGRMYEYNFLYSSKPYNGSWQFEHYGQ